LYIRCRNNTTYYIISRAVVAQQCEGGILNEFDEIKSFDEDLGRK